MPKSARKAESVPAQQRAPADSIARLPRESSTEAASRFGTLLSDLRHTPEVVIQRHNRDEAVILSMERYRQLIQRAALPSLDSLSASFDALVARMQTPSAQRAIGALMTASPDALADAASAGIAASLRAVPASRKPRKKPKSAR